jgi:hypothetical protein
MKLALDYNIVTAEDRCLALQTLDLAHISTRELERAANYILYGKTLKGNPLPEAKQISTKHSTWKKKEPESLDALMENVMFDETSLQAFGQKSPYTNPKPKIDHEKDANIPGMQELWIAIAGMEEIFNKEQENGKTLKVYYLRHLLIDLRKEQYTLKAMFTPVISMSCGMVNRSPHEIDWCRDSGYAVQPLLTDITGQEYRGDQNWEWHTVSEHTVDLTNPSHIYHILDSYSSLRHQIYDNPTSNTAYLLYAVENLVSRTKLTPARYHILLRKIDHIPNDVIAKELREKFNIDYAINYISTIWTKEICGAIAHSGLVDRDEWQARNHPEKWKKCIRCHKPKLRDNRFFTLERNTFDGYAPICRECKKKVTKNANSK